MKIFLLLACAQFAFGQAPEIYRDTTVPFERRAADLIARMTLEEKV